MSRLSKEDISSIQELYKKYNSTHKVAEKLNCTPKTVSKHLKKCWISLSKSRCYLTKEIEDEIIKLYKEGYSTPFLANKYDTIISVIRNALIRNNVTMRHSWWVDIVRWTIQYRTRQLQKYINWRKNIMERDNYICQICNTRGGKLEVDHIIPLQAILYYNKIYTIEEANLCTELWDEQNGRTLCKSCHIKTPTYSRRYKLKKDTF